MRSALAAAVGVGVGLWMMVAPVVLGYSGSAATSDQIVGPIAAATAWIAASEITRSLRWVNVPLGLWVLLSPLVLGGPTAAAVHSVASGIALLATALAIEKTPRRKYGGGWKALIEEASRPS